VASSSLCSGIADCVAFSLSDCATSGSTFCNCYSCTNYRGNYCPSDNTCSSCYTCSSSSSACKSTVISQFLLCASVAPPGALPSPSPSPGPTTASFSASVSGFPSGSVSGNSLTSSAASDVHDALSTAVRSLSACAFGTSGSCSVSMAHAIDGSSYSRRALSTLSITVEFQVRALGYAPHIYARFYPSPPHPPPAPAHPPTRTSQSTPPDFKPSRCFQRGHRHHLLYLSGRFSKRAG
jgi:hypothetical protein